MSLFKRLCAAAALLLCSLAANAQSTYPAPPFSLPDCIPKTFWTPFGTGTDWVHGTSEPVTPTGVSIGWWAWWCPNSDGTWKPFILQCVEGRTCISAIAMTKDLDTAMRSADRLATLRSLITQRQTAVLTNELNDWAYASDMARLALQPIKPTTPTPPPPATGVYVVTGAQAFPVKPDGTRSTTPIATAPTKGETCDCTGANRIVQFGATFCKVPSLSATQTIVAGCSLKKP